MSIFIGLVIVFSAIGLVLKYRSLFRVQAQQDGCFLSCFKSIIIGVLLGFYIVGGLIWFIIKFFGLARTYYDFLIDNFLFMTFMALLIYVVFGLWLAETINPTFLFVDHTPRPIVRRLYIILLSIALFFVFSSLFALTYVTIEETGKGLLSGPEWVTGVVEMKSSSFSRSGTLYYVDINGKHLHVPDSTWWHSLEKGDEVRYAFNPHVTGTADAIRPDRISLTNTGIVLIIAGLLLWLLTIGAAWDGFAKSWKRESQKWTSSSVEG